MIAGSDKKNLALITITVISILLVVFSAYQSRNVGPGIDGVSYISIGEQYADFNLSDAINAYWSPLISWLIAPIIALGVSGEHAFLIVNAIIASLILVVGTVLVWRWTDRSIYSVGFFQLITVPLLITTVPQMTPDFLLILWILSFLSFIIHVSSKQKKRNHLQISNKELAIFGFIGGVGYVTKLYAVPVFICVLFAWFIYEFFSRKANLKNAIHAVKLYLIVIVAAFIFSAPWIATLSAKYDGFMVGSAFSVNTKSVLGGGVVEEAAERLLPPPNDSAVSFGEDRTIPKRENVSTGPNSNIFNKFKIFAVERLKVFPYVANRIFGVWILIPLILLIVPILWVTGIINYKKHQKYILLATAGLIYATGFFLIEGIENGGGNGRYHWPEFFISAVILSVGISEIWLQIKKKKNIFRKVGFVVLCSVSIISAQIGYVFGYYYATSIPIGTPLALYPSDKGRTILYSFNPSPYPVNELIERIKEDDVLQPGSKIVGDNYRKTVLIGYYTNTKVFGETSPDNYYNLRNPEKAMAENDIDYVLRFTAQDGLSANSKPVGTYGRIIKTYNLTMTCDDERIMVFQPCTVDVVKVEN